MNFLENELFEKLYNVYYFKVYSYILSLCTDESLAEELTDQTFFKVFTAKSEFRSQSSAFTYICAISKNLYFDYLKSKRKFSSMPNEIGIEENIENNIINKETSLKIHLALHELKDPYKEVFELRVFGELSFVEIGTVFGKTESWARVTYHRAKLMIKERI